MKVGDVVVPVDFLRDPFRSGAEWYSHAIVVSVDPFVMVSERGDMLWSERSTHTVVVLCQADPKIVDVALDRFRRDYATKPKRSVGVMQRYRLWRIRRLLRRSFRYDVKSTAQTVAETTAPLRRSLGLSLVKETLENTK